MKTIFVVHVEDMFRDFYPADYLHELGAYLAEQSATARIVGLVSEIEDFHHCDEVRWCEDVEWSWSWGYEPDMFDEDDAERQWIIESTGHEWTFVPSEIRNGSRPVGEVEVVGGYSAECLADWVAILDHQGIPYKVNWDHVY